MSLNDKERRIMVEHESRKARQTFAQAETLRRDGYWDGVANRLYYASFHAVNALLIHVRTHHGTGHHLVHERSRTDLTSFVTPFMA